jgi:ABC-type branched-subunit amino acid transport system ATPase component/branched-subunit amino acid ABC-type transport system permease component
MVTGAIYSIMASGLVLTYQTSGVFNFSHAAVAFTSAYFYFQINTGQSIPIVPSLIITVFIFAPLLGLALDRIVLGRLSTAPVYARIVGTIGLLIALPNFVQWLVNAVAVDWLGLDLAKLSDYGADVGFIPPGVGPTPTKVYRLGWLGLENVSINSDQLAVFIVAALVAVLLYVIVRRTRVGLEMRAQVDRESLAALRGISPRRTSGIAWMLSMTLASLGGVLIAPLFQLSDTTYLFVVLASVGAVAIAGMRSIPLAFAAGLGLGVLQNLIGGYKTEWLPKFLSELSGLDAAVPYLVLLVALFVVGRERGRAAGSVSDEKPAPDHRAGLPGWRRKLPWAIFTVVLVLYTLGALPWPNNPSFVRSNILAPGIALGIVFLSFVVVTGIGGMVSLAQATFVTAGGFMAGWALQTADAVHPPPWASWTFDIPFVVHNGQMNFLVACLLGAIVAALLGATVAFPVRRMGTLALALATFALSWVMYFIVFQNDDVANGTFGYSFRFPTFDVFGLRLPGWNDQDATFDFSRSAQVVCALLIVFGIVTLLIHNLQRSPSGRAMFAVRSSSVAAQTSGISPARAQVALFALSAGIAGFGGSMYGLTAFSITRDSVPPLIGLIWLAVAVTFGVRRPGGALLAGLAFTGAPVIWQELASFSWMPSFLSDLITSTYFTPMLFGLGAINLAKNPDGLLAMIGHRKLEKRREKERQARIATAESELHHGEAVPEPEAVPEERVLEVVGAAGMGSGDYRPPVILLEQVVAGYGDVEVLHGVTVAVGAGEVVALLGANGAGKSTLCNVTAGLVPITSGRVLVAGVDVTEGSAFSRVRQGLLLVPEARGIFPGLTVEENLQVLLRDPALRQEAYERFPILGERRKQVAGLLSGGEQQMLSLAPALADPPAALIADEPTLGLAPLAAEVVIEALRELRGLGTAILLVEEKASEVMKVADIVAFMELGRVVWMGPREEADEERLAAAYLGGKRAGGG